MKIGEKLRNFHLGTDPLFQIFLIGVILILIGWMIKLKFLKWAGIFVIGVFVLFWILAVREKLK